MKRDSRLSGVLHILLHLAETESPETSARLAEMMRTNPVVVRRTLAGLREQGLVRSEKGHGGGWTIASDLDQVTLYDIYAALESPELFAIGNRSEHPTCAVEQVVNDVMNDTMQEAEELLLSRLREVTLRDLHRRFHERRSVSPSGQNPLHHTA